MRPWPSRSRPSEDRVSRMSSSGSSLSARRASSRWTAALCLFGILGCADEPEDPFVPQQETARLRIGLTFEGTLCRGHLDMWEEHLDILEQTFDLDRDEAWILLYDDEDGRQISTDCGWRPDIDSDGCWRDPLVRSILEAVPHELVHAWFGARKGRALPFLREGIAERMGGDVQHREAPTLGISEFLLVDSVEDEPDFPSHLYREAGHFVAWLLDTYGPEKFVALYIDTARGMTETEATAVFKNVLGLSLDEVLSAYEATAKEYYPSMGGAACSEGPVVPWQGDAATWQSDGTCAEGPLFGYVEGRRWQRVTVEVPSAGTYRLEPGQRYAAILRCLKAPLDEVELPVLHADGVGGDWLASPPRFSGNAYDFWDQIPPAELEPGTYEVWVERTDDVPGMDSTVRLRRL